MSGQGFSVLVVDDEAPARQDLMGLLERSPQVGQIDDAESAAECLAAIEADPFDVVFLDIRMPELDGLELGRVIGRLPAPPSIVFVTAYEQHALEAFGVAAVDYLLKPVRAERLQMTLGRLQQLRSGIPAAATAGSDRLPVVAGGGITLLSVDDIRLIGVDGDHIRVRTAERTYLCKLSMRQLQEQLGESGFLRVHRSYLINLRHVTAIESFINGGYLVRLDGISDLAVPVARRQARQLKEVFRL